MKKHLIIFSLALFVFACGSEEVPEEKPQESSTPSSSSSTNSNPLNSLINNAVNEVSEEINHQVSDPNSEFLEAIDTIKDVLGEKVVEPLKNEVEENILNK